MTDHDHNYLSTLGAGEPARGPLDGLTRAFSGATATEPSEARRKPRCFQHDAECIGEGECSIKGCAITMREREADRPDGEVCDVSGHIVLMGTTVCVECGCDIRGDQEPPHEPLPIQGMWPCQRRPARDAPPRLLAAIYVLLRDYVQPGDMEQVMLNVAGHHDHHAAFTNGWLERLARSHVTYLLEIGPGVHTGQIVGEDECDDPNCPVCGVP